MIYDIKSIQQRVWQDRNQEKCTVLIVKYLVNCNPIEYSLLHLLAYTKENTHRCNLRDIQQVLFHPYTLCNLMICILQYEHEPYKPSSQFPYLISHTDSRNIIQGTKWMIRQPRISSPTRIIQKRCQKYLRFVNTFFPYP